MNLLEVTWVPDETIRPPGPKMVVCIDADMGWFFRINTRDGWRPNVPLAKTPDHEWLLHDSFMECNILELDDYVVEEAIRRSGVIGVVHPSLCPAIRDAIRQNRGMSNTDKMRIHATMQALGR